MRIGFYINPVARLREQHPSGLPDPTLAAALAESAGAQLILAGWVPLGGLLTERDVLLTRELVRGDLVIVTPLREDAVDSVLKFHPDGVVLVEPTWDGIRQGRPIQTETDADLIGSVAGSYKSAGLGASLLIEPNAPAVKSAARFGVAGVVLDCTVYASARTERDAEAALDRIGDAAMAAGKFGLVAAAAHGLTAQNVAPVASQRYLEELYFGQGIVARALIVGLNDAVREMVTTARHSRPNVG